MTATVAIGIGLTDAVLGPEQQYTERASHVGRTEAERLLGAGREYGHGPLPTFLAEFALARRNGAPLGLLLLPHANGGGEPGAGSIVAPLAPYLRDAEVIPGGPTPVPWSPILAALHRISDIDPLRPRAREDHERMRFLLFGCHTEQGVLATALFLRGVLGYAQVAVSPHLVGSATSEAHLAALRHHLPRAGVRVLLHLREAAEYLGIDVAAFTRLGCTACALEPAELGEAMGEGPRRIVELVCLHWTKAQLRPLSGGFSGSLLLLASGWKGESRTEPMVIKVDHHRQMRREIDGYHMVKDLLGKHVPTFDYPVALGDSLGVGMDLAAMEGSPVSLQDSFELAESDEAFARFLRRIDKALALLSGRLYRNTRRVDWFCPYRAFHLHTDMQQQWLGENLQAIRGHWHSDTGADFPLDGDLLGTLLRMVAHNEDGVESEVCLVHGDLNFKNVICDEGDNVWFIDWTHCGRMPIELDFAKMENDVKFVMSKQFGLEDLGRLRQLESYLLTQAIPASLEQLPEPLRFTKWDLRFRKILLTVRRIRQACFALKSGDDWLVYRTALLKYALHSLSFDTRRGRGECDLPQLMHALQSLEGLLNDLVVDDFHLKIRGERPPSYPPRQRVSIDLAPWSVDCPEYHPPYYVAPEVLANDRTRVPGGWADPEDVDCMSDDLSLPGRHDARNRPLHPFGRTGLAGRGALGRWGPNVMVIAIPTRQSRHDGGLEILLGSREGSDALVPPHDFARAGESTECALARVLEAETGWRPPSAGTVLSEGYGYDARRTDHAWVVTSVRHVHLGDDSGPALLRAGGSFESVSWFPLDAATVNRMPATSARHARDAVRALRSTGQMPDDAAAVVLAATG